MIENFLLNSPQEVREALRLVESSALLSAHCRNVAYYAVSLFDRLPPSSVTETAGRDELFIAALLHDIGKTRIENHLLEKPAKLSPEEYERVKRHSQEGADILSAFPFGPLVTASVLHHHERFDGKGYPAGLSDSLIPLFSRIIAVADAFDAMTTFRHYRKTLSCDYALGEILENAGTQFDPRIAEVFIRLVEQGSIRFPG